ncbi:Transcriptional activator of fatty acid utilization, partial [Pichia californica]
MNSGSFNNYQYENRPHRVEKLESKIQIINETSSNSISEPNSTSLESNVNISMKRDRSSRACFVCRQRKVKCDAALCYPNKCTNCVLFKIKNCYIPAPKKRKSKKIEELLKSHSNVELDSSKEDQSISNSNFNNINDNVNKIKLESKYENLTKTSSQINNPHYPPFVIPGFQIKHPELSIVKLDPSVVFERDINSIDTNAEYFEWLGSFTGTLTSDYIKNHENNGFIKISEMSYNYLLSMGCFNLPDIETCWKYINTFFSLRLFQYPVISEKEFRSKYTDLTNPPSLLLLHAIIFCGARFYDENHWDEKERLSHLERIDILYSRAKAFYDQRIESDFFTKLQALLVMGNYKNINGYNIKADFSYLRLSLELCFALGIHKNPDTLPNIPPLRKKLYKRIWWSMLTVDTLFTFVFYTPSAFDKLFTNEISLITIDDLLDDPETATQEDKLKALHFVQRTRLILCVRKICEKVGQEYNHSSLSSESDHFQECDQMLREWIEQLPTSLLFKINSSTNTKYNASLSLEYYSVLLLLHRIYIMRSYSSNKRDQISPSWGIVFKSAHMVAVIGRYIMDNNLITFLQMIIPYSMNIAGLMMLYHLHNKDKNVHRIANEDMHIFLEILNRVSFTYPHIKIAYFYLKSLYEDKSKQDKVLKYMINDSSARKNGNVINDTSETGDDNSANCVINKDVKYAGTQAVYSQNNSSGCDSTSNNKTLNDKRNENLNNPSSNSTLTDVPVNSILYYNNSRKSEILGYNNSATSQNGKLNIPIPFISQYGNSAILPVPQSDNINIPSGFVPNFIHGSYNSAVSSSVSAFIHPNSIPQREQVFSQLNNATLNQQTYIQPSNNYSRSPTQTQIRQTIPHS